MTESKDTGNREIDLLELITRIFRTLGNWVSSFFRFIISTIIFLFKKWLPLSISIILGAATAYLLFMTIRPVFSTEMTCKSNTVANADMIGYLNNLHEFCRAGNINALSSALNIKPSVAIKVKDIRAFWVIDRHRDGIPDYTDYKFSYNVYDTMNVRMQDRLVVRVRFKSLDDLPSLRGGIFNYINNNSYFKLQNSIRLQLVDELITRLTYDIRQLDSLQKIKYYEETKNMTPQKNGQMVFLQEQKTQLVYEDIYKLYERKQTLTREKTVNPDILTIISDFSLPQKPFRGVNFYGIITVPLFFILTLFVLGLIALKEKIRDLFRKY